MLPQGTLAELINESIYMSPAPTAKHQRIVGKLYRLLADHVEKIRKGEVFISPFDVYLDETSNAVQPDIIFVAAENSRIVKEDSIHGVPDLLIEVLSPGNSRHDRTLKKDLYQKFGVKEYWIIEPETKECIGFTLENGIYLDCENGIGKIKSLLLTNEFTF